MNRLFLTYLLTLAPPGFVMSAWAGSSPRSHTRPFQTGMDLGVGVDETSSAPVLGAREHCLKPFSVAKFHEPIVESFRIAIAKDRSQLREIVALGAAIGLPIGPFSLTIEAAYYSETEADDNSVFVVFQGQVRVSEFAIDQPRFTDDSTIRSFYQQDYSRFREICGDGFIRSISTGSRYYGIVEVKARSRYERMRIYGALSGSYIPFGVTITGGLELVFEKLTDMYSATISIVSQGDNRADDIAFQRDLAVASVEEDGGPALDRPNPVLGFLDDVEKYRQKVLNDQRLKQDYRSAASWIVYEPYEQIASPLIKEGDPAIERDIVQDYLIQIKAYKDIEDQALAAMGNPFEYEAMEERRGDLELLLGETRWHLSWLLDAYGDCTERMARNCLPVDKVAPLGAEKAETLAARLPRRKLEYPRSCRDLQRLQKMHTDGEYTLYLAGNPKMPFSMFCASMETEEPKEYLTLRHVSPDGANPRSNFAKVLKRSNSGQFADETTIYDKLLVKVGAYHLTVISGQDEFVRVGANARRSEFGVATSCEVNARIGANMNLKGTPFLFRAPLSYDVEQGRQFVLVNNQSSWSEAREAAARRGGKLLSIFDDMDNWKMRSIMLENGIGAVWLGLMETGVQTFEFEYVPGEWRRFSYRNWSPTAHLLTSSPDVRMPRCVFMGDDGLWYSSSCDDVFPFVFEYGKTLGQVREVPPASEIPSQISSQEFEISAATKWGDCGSFGPNQELILEYSPALAGRLMNH